VSDPIIGCNGDGTSVAKNCKTHIAIQVKRLTLKMRTALLLHYGKGKFCHFFYYIIPRSNYTYIWCRMFL